jgi:hypothetical protein
MWRDGRRVRGLLYHGAQPPLQAGVRAGTPLPPTVFVDILCLYSPAASSLERWRDGADVLSSGVCSTHPPCLAEADFKSWRSEMIRNAAATLSYQWLHLPCLPLRSPTVAGRRLPPSLTCLAYSWHLLPAARIRQGICKVLEMAKAGEMGVGTCPPLATLSTDPYFASDVSLSRSYDSHGVLREPFAAHQSLRRNRQPPRLIAQRDADAVA